MTEEITSAVADVGTKAALDLSLSMTSSGVMSVSLKIDNIWLAGAVSLGALTLGAFYLANKGPSEDSVRKALQRMFLGAVDPEVINIIDGHSIIVKLCCHTAPSLLLFIEDFESKTVQFRLQNEFKKIGFDNDLEVFIINEEEVYEKIQQIRDTQGLTGRRVTLTGGLEQENSEQENEEFVKRVKEIYDKHVTVLGKNVKNERLTEGEPFNITNRRLDELDNYLTETSKKSLTDAFQSREAGEEPNNLLAKLNNFKEKAKREEAIAKGLRSTMGKLQEENAKMREDIKKKQVDIAWNETERKTLKAENLRLNDLLQEKENEIKKAWKENRDLREEAYVLQKENEISQQKLKAKEKELERIENEEPDVNNPQSRSRASSTSSGYQSGEEPDEPVLEITEMPRSQAVQEGKSLILSCRARGLADIHFRWIKDGVEVSGSNRPDLVLSPVKIRDFGSYVCLLKDKTGCLIKKTEAAHVDVFPCPQMRFRGLHELEGIIKEDILDLLRKKRSDGQSTWKPVARRYGIKDTTSAEGLLNGLMTWAPNLTVYYFCKTLKESVDLIRSDVMENLLKSMVLPVK